MFIESHPNVSVLSVTMPIVTALIFITLCSLLREPTRQKFSAVFVAGAG
ncbi:DUF6010 family protein [Paraburkholderia caribensis]|nr:DUF6010 family protein [Paraburkholderia caribensis]